MIEIENALGRERSIPTTTQQLRTWRIIKAFHVERNNGHDRTESSTWAQGRRELSASGSGNVADQSQANRDALHQAVSELRQFDPPIEQWNGWAAEPPIHAGADAQASEVAGSTWGDTMFD